MRCKRLLQQSRKHSKENQMCLFVRKMHARVAIRVKNRVHDTNLHDTDSCTYTIGTFSCIFGLLKWHRLISLTTFLAKNMCHVLKIVEIETYLASNE